MIEVYPSWAVQAYEEWLAGVAEITGPRHHERIQMYHRFTNVGDHAADEVPWCSSAINFCVMVKGFRGTDDALARSWLHWGHSIEKPVRGCIAVLWRGTRDGPSGHVGIFTRDLSPYVELLGANQSDRWEFSRYANNRVLSYRMPDESDRIL